MNLSIVSVFPDLFGPFLSTSLIKRACSNGLVTINLDSFFSYVEPKERIDAPAFGPGAGMLIKPAVVQKAIDANEAKHGTAYKIFFSPQGKQLDQQELKRLAAIWIEKKHIMLLSARYEGMDARVEQEYADEIISIGNYVLMGGDLPAMILAEGLFRYIPGVVGRQDSVEQDSFVGPFVDYPTYTEPLNWKERSVPDIVRSGNHKLIEQWRRQHAVQQSVLHHFTWVQNHIVNNDDKKVAATCIPVHYVALCHANVLIGEAKTPGTTSVTSIDIHDIARSCKTYGIKNYLIVTPLIDQQKIVGRFLDFWKSDTGTLYNAQRQKAILLVNLAESIDKAIAEIKLKEGKEPLVIATSAREVECTKKITFFDQEKVWKYERPILILLGTGKGLTADVIAKCDYVLEPVGGFTDFNHLSVRSAAAIILDRWLGIHNKKI